MTDGLSKLDKQTNQVTDKHLDEKVPWRIKKLLGCQPEMLDNVKLLL